MDAKSYQQVQETIRSNAILGARSRRLKARGDCYRRRALVLIERLREEREYRRSAEHLADAYQVELLSLRATANRQAALIHQVEKPVDYS